MNKPTKSTCPNLVETNNEAAGAIPKSQQDPVAIVGSNFQLLWCREHWAIGVGVGDKLYAFPPKKEWVGLTNDELDILWEKQQFTEFKSYENDRIEYAKLVEAKLKEKNA